MLWFHTHCLQKEVSPRRERRVKGSEGGEGGVHGGYRQGICRRRGILIEQPAKAERPRNRAGFRQRRRLNFAVEAGWRKERRKCIRDSNLRRKKKAYRLLRLNVRDAAQGARLVSRVGSTSSSKHALLKSSNLHGFLLSTTRVDPTSLGTPFF